MLIFFIFNTFSLFMSRNLIAIVIYLSTDEFNIYTREAGAGGLSIAVEGPSKAEVDFEDRKDGSCGVTYQVTEPGNCD
jgi:hypothetical protein